jgi:hypothetical protein
MGIFVALLFSFPAAGTTAYILRDKAGFVRTVLAGAAGLGVRFLVCVIVGLVISGSPALPVQGVIGTALGVLGAALAANRPVRAKRKPGDLRDK